MIIKQLVWPMVLVGFPNIDVRDSISITKLDYTVPYSDCQKQKSTIEYNYITNEDLIEYNYQKYNTIIR